MYSISTSSSTRPPRSLYFAVTVSKPGGITVLFPRRRQKARSDDGRNTMEAIAIVSLVASTASLAKVLTSGADALYAFSKASKVVNQTLESLYRETRALVQTIESVNVALSHLGTQHLNDIQEEHKGVWATLRDSVDNCCITAEEIDKELNSIKIKKCGFLTKPLRQYKLRLRDEGINRLRSQLSTHGQSLMLCLATINM